MISTIQRKACTLLFTLLVAVLPLLFFILPSVSVASNGGSNFSVTLANPIEGGPTSFIDFLKLIFDSVIIPIGAVVAALAIIYSGFLFVVAQGNPAKLTTARNALLWSLIGTAVLLGSWALAQGISSTVECIRDPGTCQ